MNSITLMFSYKFRSINQNQLSLAIPSWVGTVSIPAKARSLGYKQAHHAMH